MVVKAGVGSACDCVIVCDWIVCVSDCVIVCVYVIVSECVCF